MIFFGLPIHLALVDFVMQMFFSLPLILIEVDSIDTSDGAVWPFHFA